MNVLKTTKVVVIDDQPEEAIPVLKALGKIGVGAIYFSGDPDELPETPLKGIRLLFLDLDLNGGGGEEEKIIGQTLSVIDRIVAKEPSPLAIIVWTKHTDYVEALKKKLEEDWSVLAPGFVTNLQKPGEFNEDVIAKITETFAELVRNSFPLELLWSWEQAVHDAAVETTSLLAEVASIDTNVSNLDSWNTTMSCILGKLGIAVAGQQLYEEENLLHDVFAALNPVHMDHLERKTTALDLEGEKVKSLFKNARESKSDGKAESKLNSPFMIAEVMNVQSMAPGNIYQRRKENSEDKFPLSKTEKLFGSLVYDVIDPMGDEDYNELNERIREARESGSEMEDQLAAMKKDLREKADELRKNLKEKTEPVLLEITPACDFAQRKNKMSRLVGGLLVPMEMIHLIKRNSIFLKIVGPLEIKEKEGPQYLLLNSHFLFGYPEPEKTWKTTYRLRSQVLVDVQAWFASHAARPGYTSITP